MECIAAASLGYREMKRGQLDDVVQFLNGNDVFAILPTGFGKSLCFACLPGAFNHLRSKALDRRLQTHSCKRGGSGTQANLIQVLAFLLARSIGTHPSNHQRSISSLFCFPRVASI